MVQSTGNSFCPNRLPKLYLLRMLITPVIISKSALKSLFFVLFQIYMKVLLWLICTISYDNMRFIPLSEFKSSEECERSKIEFVKKGYVAENLICAEPK